MADFYDELADLARRAGVRAPEPQGPLTQHEQDDYDLAHSDKVMAEQKAQEAKIFNAYKAVGIRLDPEEDIYVDINPPAGYDEFEYAVSVDEIRVEQLAQLSEVGLIRRDTRLESLGDRIRIVTIIKRSV